MSVSNNNDAEMDARKTELDNDSGNVEVEFVESNAEAATDSRTDSEPRPEEKAPEPEEPTAESELAQTRDRLLRLAAEFENYKKRTARQNATIAENAQAEILSDLLSIQDNLERALSVDHAAADYEGLKRGIELIAAQIGEILKRNGVLAFESRGERFDPNLHEAVMTVAADEAAEDSVVDEFAKGYKYKDRVLRHAKVSVAGRKSKDEQ